jgi:hypothetical protein
LAGTPAPPRGDRTDLPLSSGVEARGVERGEEGGEPGVEGSSAPPILEATDFFFSIRGVVESPLDFSESSPRAMETSSSPVDAVSPFLLKNKMSETIK